MNFQEWLMANSNSVQLVAFYGLFVFLGLLEVWIPLSRLSPDRKKRWTSNLGLTFLAVLVSRALPLSGYGTAIWASSAGVGLLNYVSMPPLIVLITAMVGRSLSSWLLHVSMHKVPFLWRLHRIHHLDQVMDVTTTVRFHPVEIVMSIGTGILTVASLGLPLWALLVYDPFETAVRIFSHANIRLPERVDRVLRLLISTPAMHRLHHSVFQKETDSNYGTIFSFWDRLFRTYISPAKKDLARMSLGLAVKEKSKIQSFWWLLENPFLGAGEGIRRGGRE